MKVKTITCEHTRQVKPFEPVRFAITAEIGEGENPIEAAKKLQELVLMVIYKDDAKQRDHLLQSLIYDTVAPVTRTPNAPINGKPLNGASHKPTHPPTEFPKF